MHMCNYYYPTYINKFQQQRTNTAAFIEAPHKTETEIYWKKDFNLSAQRFQYLWHEKKNIMNKLCFVCEAILILVNYWTREKCF